MGKVQTKQAHDCKIGGMSFRLISSHDDKTVAELVSFVNEKINQAMEGTQSASVQNAAVLAALNIAEELILLKRRAGAELDQIDLKLSRLSTDLERSPVWNRGNL